MAASTDFTIELVSNEEANQVASILKRMASDSAFDMPEEVNDLIAGIVVEEKYVIVKDNHSLTCKTFFAWIPQILIGITWYNIGTFTMEACYRSYSCGYRAIIKGEFFKNGTLRMAINQENKRDAKKVTPENRFFATI